MNDDSIFRGPGEMRAIMRSFDWSLTPLGPPERWPQSLRTTVQTMLASRYAMWMGWGPELTFFYNDTYGRVTLGKKHPWALGKPAHIVWSEIWQVVGPRIDSVFATGEATWDEGLLLFLERSGFSEETYHTFSYSPLANDEGQLAGMLCVVTEETERVLGERQLASLRDLAATLTRTKTENAVLSAICDGLQRNLRDLPFTLIYTINEARTSAILAAHSGFPDGQAFSLAPSQIVLDQPSGLWPIGQVLNERTMISIDLTALDVEVPSGAWPEPPVKAVAIPISGRGDDAPTGVLIAGLNRYRNLDENYRGYLDLVAGQIASGLGNARAYEQERRRAEALAELDRAKTTFFSNISHELRTPLTLMLGPLEDELEKSRILGAETGGLQVIQRNSLRLLKLVNTLLEFSRVESGRMQARFRPVDLPAFTANLVSSFRSAIERAALTLSVEGDPIGEGIYVDTEMWEKITLNLVSNAFKSTFEGGITVRVRKEGRHAVLEVSDTGTGIPEADIPHLFERFRRIEGARRRTHEGSGIGLALVHELVKMHGGSISVRSRVGEGTTFRVELLLGTDHLPADQVHSPDDQNSLSTSGYVEEAESWIPRDAAEDDGILLSDGALDTGHGAERATVMVVDDNRDMREYITSVLGKRFQVRSAENGRVALASVVAFPPDLILTDVMMPEMDGFGLLAAIRQHASLSEIPVILLSARAGEESRVEGMEAGADDYLVKPFTARELLARVSAHAGMARLRREAASRERELLKATETERRRLEALLVQAPAAICVLSGPEHRFTLANAMYLELIGLKRGREIQGKPLLEALPEIASQGFNELLDQVYETGIPYIGNERAVELARGANGEIETVYVNFVYQPWRRPDGTIEGVFVHAVDVTESVIARQTMERLTASVQQNEARLRAVLQQVVSGICQMDAGGNLAFHNDRLTVISGRSAHDFDTMSFFDLARSDFRQEIRNAVHKLFQGGDVVELVECWVRPDGTEVWVQQNLSGVRNELGTVYSVVCVVQDVTAKKDVEEALRRSEKLAAVGQLASTIAHEINNPLEAVTNLLYLMKGAESMDEIQAYAATASSELMRVSHVVTSTLRFHRQPLQLAPEQIVPLIESAVMLYDARIRSSEIEILTRFRKVPSIFCFGMELRQVFSNLIGNAFDATRNAPVRKLYLRVAPTHQMLNGKPAVRITFADSGTGMDAETQKRLFGPFFSTKGINGSGLGLWLSLEILRKHKATLRFKTATGKGTVFSIVIPEQWE